MVVTEVEFAGIPLQVLAGLLATDKCPVLRPWVPSSDGMTISDVSALTDSRSAGGQVYHVDLLNYH